MTRNKRRSIYIQSRSRSSTPSMSYNNSVVGQPSNSQDMNKSQGLIAVNDLTYILEPDLSVASNKTHKNHHFQSATYSPTQSAICILNSGADYIDTRRSWFQFELEFKTPNTETTYSIPGDYDSVPTTVPDTTTHGAFGVHGSACNVISSIVISTRSGDELCHLTDFNLMQNMLIPLQYGREWADGPGQLMGFGGGVGNGKTQRFAIPMYILSPLFGYGRLMPSMLMSGMRIEITWASPEIAFQCVKNTALTTSTETTVYTSVERVVDYAIHNPQFVLSSVQLSDSIQRSLNELSATNGLEIVYCDYSSTKTNSTSALLEINTEVRKSCSRALKAFARVRNVSYNAIPFNAGLFTDPSNGVDDTGIGVRSMNDSFRGEASFPFKEYQWQLGSLYFPQQPVTGGSDDVTAPPKCAVSAYAHLLEAVDKYHDNAPIFNTFKEIPNGGYKFGESYYSRAAKLGYTTDDAVKKSLDYGYTGQSSTVAVTLERSTMFNLAGVPVNNSRVLALRGKLSTVSKEKKLNDPDGASATKQLRTLDIFLKYVKLARVFLNNVEVEQ